MISAAAGQKRLPVLLISPRYAPTAGGVERHVEELARGLVRLGAEVEVVTTDPSHRLPATEKRDGVLVHRFPTLANDGTYFLSPSLGWWLLRNASRFGVLHAHSYHTPLALQAALVSFLTGVPLVFTPHYHGTGHSPVRRVLHVPYRFAAGWLLGRTRQLICVSYAERSLLRQRFGSSTPTVVLPNGVEPRAEFPARNGRRPGVPGRILAVGRQEHYKQTSRIVEALPDLPNYEVDVVGEGAALRSIERLAKKLKVFERVHLLGSTTEAELLRRYAEADVFVSVSRHEAFGITILEAAIAGAALVLSSIPAHIEVLNYIPGARVNLVDVDCAPTELAQAILEAEAREPRASASDWRVPGWQQMVDGVWECYGELLNWGPPAAEPELLAG